MLLGVRRYYGDSMSDLRDCEHLVGRLRQICRGEAGLPRATVDQYRVLWGLKPLPRDAEVIVIDSPATRSALVAASSPQPEMPPLLGRVWAFAKAVTRSAAGGFRRRTKTEIAKRLAICEACPFYDKTHCLKCGCNCTGTTEYLNKLAWETEQCPDGRW